MSVQALPSAAARGLTYVVGAGIVGLCVAWHLQRKGVPVIVVDREDPAKGCSFGNAGALSCGSVAPLAMPGLLRNAASMLLDPDGPLHIPFHYWLKAAPWLLRFTQSSRPAEVERIAETLSLLLSTSTESHAAMLAEIGRSDLIRATGQLYLYRNAAHLHSDDGSWTLRRRYGLRTEVMARNQFLEIEPAIGPAYQVGVFTPQQGMSIDPYRHAIAIAEDFIRNGGEIIRDEVFGIEISDDRAVGIRTAGGLRPADRVILCAGAWSARLLAHLGYDVPLETQRGYHVRVAGPDARIGRPVVLADRKVFVTPMADGVRAAGTVEFGGLDMPPTRRRAELLVRHFAEAFPAVRPEPGFEMWMGHRPCLPDSLPVLGESAWHRNLWFAFGHGHLGLTTAAVTGRLIAAGVAGERQNIPMERFSIHRFERTGKAGR